MKFIGVDIGSSFIKGAVLDVHHIAIEHVTRRPFPEPLAGLPPRHFEIDPAAVIEAVRQVLGELVNLAPDCGGILFTSQMGGVVLVAAERSGYPALTNYISWRDERTTTAHPSGRGSYLDVAGARLGSDVLRRVGNELRAGSATALLFWLAEKNLLPAGAMPLSLGDLVVSRLCNSPPVMEPTQALGTLDLETGAFCQAAFEPLGLTQLNWPRLTPASQPAGTVPLGGRKIPCYPVVGDHQCALAGALLAEGELSLNISTGSQASLLRRELVLGDYQTRPYFGGRFLSTITHLPAGRSLDVLMALLIELAAAEGVTLHDAWPNLVRAAETADDSDLAVDLAFFAGPLGSRGSISNISTANLTAGRLFRSALRSMAANYAACAARISPERTWRRIVFSGGLAQKLDLLRQFILEQLPGAARLCASAEDTLLGLLVLGLVISGRAKDLDEANRIVNSGGSL